MFSIIEKRLNKKLTDLEIREFKHKIINNTDIVKINIDPVNKTSFVAYFIGDDKKSAIEKQINSFLKEWEQNENNENEQMDYNVVEVAEPNLNTLKTHCNCPNHENVSDELLEKGWIKLLKGRDVGFEEEIIKLLEFFDQSYIKFMNKELANEKVKKIGFSSLISNYYIKKLGYFENNPEHLFFASHLNFSKIKEFSKRHENTELNKLESDNNYWNEPEYTLQSAPCFKIYFSLENEILKDNLIFNIIGSCYRNETKNTYLLERLLNFSMREYVFIGSPEHIINYRDVCLKTIIKWMNTLGLSGHVEKANDPFFISEQQKNSYDIPSSMKFEVRSDVPYKESSISIASFDTHGNYFSNIFNFSLENNQDTWSGCIGVGLERCVWSFLQQYGLDKNNWPDYVRNNYE